MPDFFSGFPVSGFPYRFDVLLLDNKFSLYKTSSNIILVLIKSSKLVVQDSFLIIFLQLLKIKVIEISTSLVVSFSNSSKKSVNMSKLQDLWLLYKWVHFRRSCYSQLAVKISEKCHLFWYFLRKEFHTRQVRSSEFCLLLVMLQDQSWMK